MEIGVVDGRGVVARCEMCNVERGKNGAAGEGCMQIPGQAGDVVVPLYAQLPQMSTRHKSPSTSPRDCTGESCMHARRNRSRQPVSRPTVASASPGAGSFRRSESGLQRCALCGRRSVTRQVRPLVRKRQDRATLTLERCERTPKIALGLGGAGRGMDSGVGRGAKLHRADMATRQHATVRAAL